MCPRTDALEQLIERVRIADLPVARGALDSLPILDRYRRRCRARLDGFHALFVQHHLAPLTARVRAMNEDGLNPARTWFLDIPYSTSMAVSAHLRERLPSSDRMAVPFTDPFACYSRAQRRRALDVLTRLADASEEAPLLVIDDGAYVLRTLASPSTPRALKDRFRGARIVEQTTRGHRFVAGEAGRQVIDELGIVAVSVARAETKVRFEAPFIGMAVAAAVRRLIARQDLEPRRGLIIGYGSVGAATAEALREEYPALELCVVDIDPSRRRSASAKGLEAAPVVPVSSPSDERHDLVVGCTGGTSFTWKNRGILADEAVLASGSSAAVELDRARLVEHADSDPQDEFELLNDRDADGEDIHADLRFRHGPDRRFTILRAGFPVNFDGEPEHMPTVLIQPTHCLLYAAAVQACTHSKPGFYGLEARQDRWILDTAKQLLAEEVRRLH